MNEERYIRLAEKYVSLSNAHDLDRIFRMFATDASYSSSTVGSFEGLLQIKTMMRSFFERFPDVYWEVLGYRSITERVVVFDFTRCATDLERGDPIRVEGVERIEFTADGLIRRIEVG